MRVYLVGYMGVGKTTIGKKLAKRLGLKFIDLDSLMIDREYATISQIIENIGEDYFRKIEQQYLEEASEKHDVLISTGGGTPCFFENMSLMNGTGVTIYLKMDEKSLFQRLKNGSDSRPLLKGILETELEDFITKHLAHRKPFYSRAKYTVEALNMNSRRIEELATLIESKG